MTDDHGKRCVITARSKLRDTEGALVEVDTSELADGCLCFVHETDSLHVYLASGHSREDPPEVVRPRSGAGQWERTTCRLMV